MDEYIMDEYIEEYKQIQGLRELWSQVIVSWTRLVMPIGAALFGFLSYIGQLERFRNLPFVWLLPIMGCIIFVTTMAVWRLVVHHIDRQIVGMYPRMLELEQKLKWVTHATYYYNNLKKKAKGRLAESLGEEASSLSNTHYRDYEKKSQDQGKDPHSLLLDVWDKQRWGSVTSRGHLPQDVGVILVSLAVIGITIVLASWLWN